MITGPKGGTEDPTYGQITAQGPDLQNILG